MNNVRVGKDFKFLEVMRLRRRTWTAYHSLSAGNSIQREYRENLYLCSNKKTKTSKDKEKLIYLVVENYSNAEMADMHLI